MTPEPAYDRARMRQALQDIASDLLKLPGQPGLQQDEKFALTMLMTARLVAVLVAGQSPTERAGEALLKIVMDQAALDMRASIRMIQAARQMGFGTTLPWSMLVDTLSDEEQP